MECRGHTYDNITGELVLAAPTKSFNYGENGHWLQFSLDTPVVLYKKYNGFMATVSKYNEEIIVGTTGSTKSDFAKLAKAVLIRTYTESGLYKLFDSSDRYTMLFEICDSSDPHIVDELPGAHLLGMRYHQLNIPNGFKQWQFVPHSNGEIVTTTLEDAIQRTEYQRDIEGWMVYNKDYGICKLRTHYFLGKKSLIQASDLEIDSMYKDPSRYVVTLPKIWKHAVELIIKNFSADEWKNKSIKEKRIELEKFEQ